MAKPVKRFDEIIGHKNVVALLQSLVEKDRVPDVILFDGNPGLGKTSLAKLLAVEVAEMYSTEERKAAAVEAVIGKHESTDTIKIFNMSAISEKEEEIQKVKADLSVGFSKTGRKVLILDEAHNMSKKAQDAILPDLEHLDEGVYVFICTTEVGSLRDALVSRAYPIHLNNLNTMECKQLVRREIEQKRVRFEMSNELAMAFIMSWSDKQPRRIVKLFESMEDGMLVTSKYLDVFIATNSLSSAIELVKYLYGSLPLGLNYIESIRVDNVFVDMLVEITKVALGGESHIMSPKEIGYVRELIGERDVDCLVKFTAEVAGLKSLIKRYIVSAFMKCHSSRSKIVLPESRAIDKFKAEDMATMAENIEIEERFVQFEESAPVLSLSELFESGETVE